MAEQSLVTREDLLKIPRWARVAFAARCARRVQPLCYKPKPLCNDSYYEDIEKAIIIAEQYSSSPPSADVDGAYHAEDMYGDAVYNANIYADEIAYAIASAYAANAAAYYYTDGSIDAALAADYAIRAADNVVDTAAQTVNNTASYPAGDVLRHAESIYNAVTAEREAIKESMRFDYELLLSASEKEGWDDDAPVSPAFFGRLWPYGAPEGWPKPERTCACCELVLEIDIPDDADEKEIQAAIEELSRRATDLHRAYGGHGLKINSITAWEPAPEFVGAPS